VLFPYLKVGVIDHKIGKLDKYDDFDKFKNPTGKC